MRILAARNAAGAVSQEKSGFSAPAEEYSSNGEFAKSTDQDARDMFKLGIKQETKVR